jgi:hypothetical protein
MWESRQVQNEGEFDLRRYFLDIDDPEERAGTIHGGIPISRTSSATWRGLVAARIRACWLHYNRLRTKTIYNRLRTILKVWPHRTALPVACAQMVGGSQDIWTKAQREAGFKSELQWGNLEGIYDGLELDDGRRRRLMDKILPMLAF